MQLSTGSKRVNVQYIVEGNNKVQFAGVTEAKDQATGTLKGYRLNFKVLCKDADGNDMVFPLANDKFISLPLNKKGFPTEMNLEMVNDLFGALGLPAVQENQPFDIPALGQVAAPFNTPVMGWFKLGRPSPIDGKRYHELAMFREGDLKVFSPATAGTPVAGQPAAATPPPAGNKWG